jgi:predicted nuclease with RNAse H fold
VGIDLAGVPRRPTGIAVLRGGRLVRMGLASTDAEILAAAAAAGRRPAVAINAPLSWPLGRCCLDDDCPCRHDPGTRSRAFERTLARAGVPALATGLIKVLAWRGLRLAAALRESGIEPMEAYPFATLRILGLPWRGKRTPEGRRAIRRGLAGLVAGRIPATAGEHELDALACALTAHLARTRRARTVGDPAEGLLVVPAVPGWDLA